MVAIKTFEELICSKNLDKVPYASSGMDNKIHRLWNKTWQTNKSTLFFQITIRRFTSGYGLKRFSGIQLLSYCSVGQSVYLRIHICWLPVHCRINRHYL